MEKLIIKGKEIMTNYNSIEYPTLKPEMNAEPIPFQMSFKEFLEESADQGYTRVTFYKMTTCIRGYHKFYAKRFRKEK